MWYNAVHEATYQNKEKEAQLQQTTRWQTALSEALKL